MREVYFVLSRGNFAVLGVRSSSPFTIHDHEKKKKKRHLIDSD